MAIDWFTFVAQLMNFIILVWLLKRFLYQPILAAVDAREKKIATELLNANEKKLEAEQQFDLYQTKKENIEQQSAALLKRAVSEANLERERLLGEGRKEAEVQGLKQMDNLRKGIEQLNQNIQQQTQQQVFSITRKILIDLASVGLEQTLIEKLIEKLRESDNEEKDNLLAALKTTSHPALLRSAFRLTPEQCDFIQNELNDIFKIKIALQFETESNLVAGLELVSNGQKLAWSISNCLASLEKSMAEILNKSEGSTSSAENETIQVQQQQ
jgi:F-type H+-transporting ATPase subunit b